MCSEFVKAILLRHYHLYQQRILYIHWTSCEQDINLSWYGWTPAYSNLHYGTMNSHFYHMGLYEHGMPHFYDLIAWNRVYGATVEAQPGFQIGLSSLDRTAAVI